VLTTGSITRKFALKIASVPLALCLWTLTIILAPLAVSASDSNTESTSQTNSHSDSRGDDGIALTITTQEARTEDGLNRLFDTAAASSTSFSSSDAANAWLRDMSDRIAFRIKDPVYRVELLSLVHKHARASGLDPQIVLSVIEIESSFNRFAVSTAGARGLMQIMPFWIKENTMVVAMIGIPTKCWPRCKNAGYWLTESTPPRRQCQLAAIRDSQETISKRD